MIEAGVQWLLAILAAPEVGLVSTFVISFLSSTFLPLGSEPTVFAVIKANPALYWPTIMVATVGNTLGGISNYWLGRGAKQAFAKERQTLWFGWLHRYGAKTLLISWVPGIGDPICALAGWLKLPFWPSVFYMALGKLLRYLTVTSLLLYIPDGFWQSVGRLF
ncbi:YqaA family protein [Herminiimonas sp.]|uniref:YqaA family protein n=1 Tax=Herminiimonas sp. TaxID=1926289 RepID=UPI00271C461C|nr:YqaA family protein [Herminiimonas sp.]MDO8305737.1 YqaA family protein [Herminiimonas sp.]